MKFIKDGRISCGTFLRCTDGRQIINPSREQMFAEGWKEYTDPVYEPSESDIKNDEIARLKGELAESDYKAIKYAEGWITAEEYADVRAERQKIRDRINELESEINKVSNE